MCQPVSHLGARGTCNTYSTLNFDGPDVVLLLPQKVPSFGVLPIWVAIPEKVFNSLFGKPLMQAFILLNTTVYFEVPAELHSYSQGKFQCRKAKVLFPGRPQLPLIPGIDIQSLYISLEESQVG